MWIDVTANQRLAQGTTPIAGPRQHRLHRLKVGPAHRFVGRAAGTVGFEHLVYHFPQPRLALGDLVTTTARTADALGTAMGTLWGGDPRCPWPPARRFPYRSFAGSSPTLAPHTRNRQSRSSAPRPRRGGVPALPAANASRHEVFVRLIVALKPVHQVTGILYFR